MPINDGVISRFVSGGGGGVTLEVYYDHSGAFDPPNQAIINDSTRGHGNVALWCNNTSPVSVPVIITDPQGTEHLITVPPGTTTRTAAQLAAVSIVTRADASNLSLSSG